MDRHLILTLGRSGSNTLVNLLNQHTEIVNMGEVLGPWNRVRQIKDTLGLYPNNIAGYLDTVSQPSALFRTMLAGRNAGRLARLKTHEVKPMSQARTLGFKDSATLFHKERATTWLAERPDIKVIGLVRDNVLDRLVSWLMLQATGVVLRRDRTPAGQPTFEVDPHEIVGLLEAIDDENAQLKGMLSALPPARVYTLRYNDFYSDKTTRQNALNEIFAFLGVQPFAPEMRMKKIITRPPADVIANRGACASALRGTRFEALLD